MIGRLWKNKIKFKKFQAPLLQYIMLKNLDSVKSTLEEDKSKASILDIDKKSPLHAAAFAGTKEIAGEYECKCQ